MRSNKLIQLAASLAALLALLSSAAPIAVAATYIDASITPELVPGGAQNTFTISVVNLDEQRSIEKVYVLLNYTGSSMIAEPIIDNIKVNDATVYDDQGNQAGSWSYEVKTIEYNGQTYVAIVAYSTTAAAALGYQWSVKINFDANTTTMGGVYQLKVIAFHYTETGTYEEVDSEILEVMVDAAPPSVTVRYPGYDGANYYANIRTVGTDSFIVVNLTVTDTIDGSTQVNLSEYPVSIESCSVNITGAQLDYTTKLNTDYEMYVDIAINVTNADVNDGDRINLTCSFKDAAGNELNYSLVFIVDNIPPTIEVLGFYRDLGLQNQLYSSDTTWYSNANDATVYLVFKVYDDKGNISYKYSDLIKVYGNDTEYTVEQINETHYYVEVDTTNLNDGDSLVFTIEAYDYAGNMNQQQATLVADKQPPTVTVSYDTTQIEPGSLACIAAKSINLTLEAQDTVSGFNSGASSIYLENFTHYGDPAAAANKTLAWTTQVSLTSEGYYELKITVYDNAGNKAEYMYYIVLDNTTPTLSIENVTANPGPNDNKYYTNAGTLNLTVSFEDYSELTISIYKNGTEVYSGEFNTSQSPATITLNISDWSEGTYNITVEARDCAGNATSQSITLVVDRTPPSLDAENSGFDNINNTIIDPNAEPINYTLVFTDANPIKSYKVIVDGEDATANVSVTGINTTQLQLNLSSLNDTLESPGRHNVTIMVCDYAGNKAIYTVTYYVDVQPPTITTSNIVVEEWVIDKLTLNGTVEDDYGIGKIMLTISNSTWSCSIPLWEYNGTIVKEINLTELSPVNVSGCGLEVLGSYNVSLYVEDYYYYTKGYDASYHTLTVQDPEGIKVDDGAPTIMPATSDLGWYTEPYAVVTINITDKGIGLDLNSIEVVPGEGISISIVDRACSASSCNMTLNITAAMDGDYTFTVRAADLLGQMSEMNYTVHIDFMPPKVSFKAKPVAGGAVLCKISISDAHLEPYFYVQVQVGDEIYRIMLPMEALTSTSYYVATPEAYNEYTSWYNVLSEIGRRYAEAVNGQAVPWVVVVGGKLLVFLGGLQGNASVSFGIVGVDYVGHEGINETVLQVPAGAYEPIKLYDGWNLVSTPMTGSFEASVLQQWLLNSASGEVKAVYVYDAETGEWKVYIPGVSGETLQLRDGMGFWVYYEGGENYVLAQGMLPYVDGSGQAPPMPIIYHIYKGGNFIGFTSPAALRLSKYLESIADKIFEYVYIYVNSEAGARWYTIPVSSDGTMLPGFGMWIYAYEDADLVVPVWYSGID